MYGLDLFGVVVFAISGALKAGSKHMDLFGVLTLSAVTALGGGTLRDLVLAGGPVLWVKDVTYLVVALLAGFATFVICQFSQLPQRALLVADALGLAVFTVIGSELGLRLELPILIVVVMGMMSAAVGGLLRDLLSGEIPLIFRTEIYATAAILGSIVYVFLRQHLDFSLGPDIATFAGIVSVFGVRLMAIKYQLSLPLFLLNQRESL